MILSRQRNGGFSYTSVELMMTNEKGKVVVRANESISPFTEGERFKEPSPKEGEQPIKPNALVAALAPSFGAEGGEAGGVPGDGRPRTLPADLIEKLLNPEKTEPLSVSIGDTLVNLAEAKHTNLIASLPDDSFLYAAYLGSQKVTPSMFLYVLNQFAMNVEDKDGWLILSPKTRASARSERLDRSSLGKFVRSVDKKGKAGLDELAEYALSIRGELYNSMGYSLVNLLLGDRQDAYYEADVLRFYGLLTPIQRQTLLKGQAAPLTSLTPAETEILNKLIFGRSADLQLVQRGQAMDDQEFESFYGGIRQEPTEMFANGFPARSALKMEESTTQIAGVSPYEVRPGAYYGGQAVDANELAQRLYAKERPGIFPWMDGEPGIDALRFRFGSQRTVQLNFEFGELARMTKALQDHDYGTTTPAPYAQLPESFRKEVQAKLEEMRKNYKDMKPGDFGGGTRHSTPPP
jgi:hypothetical protein